MGGEVHVQKQSYKLMLIYPRLNLFYQIPFAQLTDLIKFDEPE